MKWSEHALEIPRTVDALQGILTVIPMQAGVLKNFLISIFTKIALVIFYNNLIIKKDH